MLPKELLALAATQAGAVTRVQALEHASPEALARLVRTRELVVLRRNVYGPADTLAARCSARLLSVRADCVVSHATAAELHAFPRIEKLPTDPELTRNRPAGEPPRTVDGLRIASVPPEHRAVVQGVAATSAARTLVDCARTMSAEEAVVVADGAVRAGSGRAGRELAYCAGWPGIAQARRVLAFADARADSALESRTRWRLVQQGLPAPELQVTLCDAHGRDVGEVDFLWREQRTILETDGRLKYTEDAVLWREKLREDALRALGAEVVRGYWSDSAQELAVKVRAAFALSAQQSVRPGYGFRETPRRRAQQLL